jgi:hypothetical protein
MYAVSHSTTLPHGRTASRLEWVHLPPLVRREVERRLGSRVVEAVSQDAGFTPGLASVLTCADGSRLFLMAASVKAQRQAAAMYREEARKLRALAGWIPAPRLKWVHEGDDWLVLGIEYVESRAPHRPWTAEDLRAASDVLVEMAGRLTPPPGGGWPAFANEFGEDPACWDTLGDVPHAAEAKALAERFAEATTGETLVHADVRDDNLLMRADGSALLCDWNWPVLGADWFDSLSLLIGPRGDGLDVEAHLAAHPLLSKVEPEQIDIVLALLAGYFLRNSRQAPPPAMPHLREVQRWQGEVCYAWLAERRGWDLA